MRRSDHRYASCMISSDQGRSHRFSCSSPPSDTKRVKSPPNRHYLNTHAERQGITPAARPSSDVAPPSGGIAVADQLIAPVIPAAGSHAQAWPGHPGGRPAARTLPLPSLPAVPGQPPDLVYGMGRIDRSGRVADRAITQALNWQAGDRLTPLCLPRRGDRPPRPARHDFPRRPAVRGDPGRAVPPLRPASRRPGPAGRRTRRGHAVGLLPRPGRRGHPGT